MARKKRGGSTDSKPNSQKPTTAENTSEDSDSKGNSSENSSGDSPGNSPSRSGAGRRPTDWEKQPFGVFVGKSPTARGGFNSQDNAVEFIKTLSVHDQERAYVAQFRKVRVKTEVVIA